MARQDANDWRGQISGVEFAPGEVADTVPKEDPVKVLGMKLVADIMANSHRVDPEEAWSIYRHRVAEAVRDGQGGISPEVMAVAGVQPDGTTIVPVPRMSAYMG